MSSILSALQDYLSEYDGMELRPLTDRPEYDLSKYAIAPAGNGQTFQDVVGRRHYRNSYVFYAMEHMNAEDDRAETWDFLEAFTAWLEEQAEDEHFPEVPSGYTVEALEVSNSMLVDLNEDGHGVYQVQIQLELSKE